MYPARRLHQCYMFLPEDRLPRHVTGQPTPPVLHVPPRGPTTATCCEPAESDPADHQLVTSDSAAATSSGVLAIAITHRKGPEDSRRIREAD